MISRVIKKTVDLDAIQKVDQLEGPLYQLEESGHTFEITCMSGGTAAAVSGTVSGRFLRADETTVYFTGTLAGNVASLTLPQSCYNVSGRFGLVVFISGNDVTSAIYAVSGNVYRSTSDTIIDPTGEIPSLEELIAQIEACEDATDDALAAAAFVPNMIAPDYADLTFPVKVGDFCTHENYVYRCKIPIASAEAWDSSKWDKVTTCGEISDIVRNAYDLENKIFATPFTLKAGYSEQATNNANIARTPWLFPVDRDILITSLIMNIKTAGNLSYGIYDADIVTATTYDVNKYTVLGKLTFAETGYTSVELPINAMLQKGQAFALATPTDTAVIGYRGTGENGFYYIDTSNQIVFAPSTCLGVTIKGFITQNGSVYNGKKVSIFGDSISTFTGWIPAGNTTYYDGSNAGVPTAADTWWSKTLRALNANLLVNNSNSGRAVSSCRDGSSAHSWDAGYKEANALLLKDGNVLPDVIIIKLGINDFNHGAYLGTYDGSEPLPSDPTFFTDAYAMMLNNIMTNFPLAEVYCCTLMPCESNNSVVGFPEINTQGESLIEWNEAIRKLAHAFGAKILDHDVCGLTYYNLSTYMGDYSSSTHKALHPNAAGHSLIANQTIHDMDNAIRTRF